MKERFIMPLNLPMNQTLRKTASATLVLINLIFVSISPSVADITPNLLGDLDRKDAHVLNPASKSHGIDEIPTTAKEFSVYFVGDEKVGAWDDQGLLNHYANLLKTSKTGIAELTAFLQDQNLNSFSLALAYARLNTISEQLKKLGVPTKQIQARVQYDPPGTLPCASPTCASSYRRVGIRVVLPVAGKRGKAR